MKLWIDAEEKIYICEVEADLRNYLKKRGILEQ